MGIEHCLERYFDWQSLSDDEIHSVDITLMASEVVRDHHEMITTQTRHCMVERGPT